MRMSIKEDVWLAEIREFATAAMMDLIREDLGVLGVKMDHSLVKIPYGRA